MKGKSNHGRGSGKGDRNNKVVHTSSAIPLVIPTVEVPPTIEGLEILLATCVQAGTIDRNTFRVWSQSRNENFGFWKGNAPKKFNLSREVQGSSTAAPKAEKKAVEPKVDKVDLRLTAFKKTVSSWYEQQGGPVPDEIRTMFGLDWKRLRLALLNESDGPLGQLYTAWTERFVCVDKLDDDGNVVGQKMDLQLAGDFFAASGLSDAEEKKTRSFFPRRPATNAGQAAIAAEPAPETAPVNPGE